jgi:hypothetical protein
LGLCLVSYIGKLYALSKHDDSLSDLGGATSRYHVSLSTFISLLKACLAV